MSREWLAWAFFDQLKAMQVLAFSCQRDLPDWYDQGNRRRYSSLSLLCLLLAATPLAHAQQTARLNPTGRMIELQSPVELNGLAVGNTIVRLDPDDTVSLEADPLLALFESRWSAATIDTLRSEATDGRLVLSQFDVVGITARYDPARLTLQIEAPLTLNQVQRLTLYNEKGLLSSTDSPVFFSSFLNLSATASQQRQDDVNERAVTSNSTTIDLEGMTRVGGPVLAYEFTYSDSGDADAVDEWQLARRSTRLLLDLPRRESRLTLGDAFSFGRGFQSSLDVLGISLGRDFALSPGRNVRPVGSQQFEIDRPSTVRIVANGELIRELRLQPGVYNMVDLPLAPGSTVFELQIEDDTGTIETLSFNALFDSALLAVGEREYGLLAGVLASTGSGSIEYREDDPVASGFVRFGALPWLTAGLNVQQSEVARLVGAEALAATPWGPILLEAGVSRADTVGAGHALAGTFQRRTRTAGGRDVLLDLGVRYTSNSFDTVDGNSAPDSATNVIVDEASPRVAYETFGGLQVRLSNVVSSGLGFSYITQHNRDIGAWTINAGLQGRLLPAGNLGWSARALQTRDSNGDRESGVILGLTYYMNSQNAYSSIFDSTDEAIRLGYEHRNRPGRVGGYSVDLGIESNVEEDLDIDAQVEYTANRFVVQLDQGAELPNIEENQRTTNTRLRLDTALAYAGGRFSIGRPIGDSFAIVKGHSSLGDRRISINPSSDGDQARTGTFGGALLPRLGSYRLRTIDYAVDDLPIGYELGAGLFRVRPPLGAGYELTVGSGFTFTVIGVLVDADSGKPLALAVGSAVPKENPEAEPISFFSNRTGKFALSNLVAGTWVLTLQGERERTVELVIDESEDPLQRIGTLEIP